LTNVGRLEVLAGPGLGGYVYSSGELVNAGVLQVDSTLTSSGVSVSNVDGGLVVNNGVFRPSVFVQDGGSSSGRGLSPQSLVLAGGGVVTFTVSSSMSVQGGVLAEGQRIEVESRGVISLQSTAAGAAGKC
jgi:hypothetical protein